MTRFVRLFSYDPVGDPTSRLRLEYDPDDGLAYLCSETVLPEQRDNPDNRRCKKEARHGFITSEVLWLAKELTELGAIMSRADADAQAELDAKRTTPTINGEPLSVAPEFRDDEPTVRGKKP